MLVPEVRYVHTERGSIAYQTFGQGPPTILVLNSWLQCLDSAWDTSVDVRLWEFYQSLGQVILLDHRGLGASDPIALERIGNLDEMAFDVQVVLGALGQEKVAVVGEAGLGHLAIYLAAHHPDRVERLALMNARAKGSVAGPIDSLDEFRDQVRRNWGITVGERKTWAAFRAHINQDVIARSNRLAASPGVAAAMAAAVAQTDVRDLLGLIDVPTLVMYTGDLLDSGPLESEALAGAIPAARFVNSASTSFYWGPYAEELATFLSGRPWAKGEREVAAVAFTDVVASTALASSLGDLEWRRVLQVLDDRVAQETARSGGQVIKQTGDGHLLAFKSASDALTTVDRVVRDAPGLGVHLRAGVHFAEVERRPNGDLGGLGVHICARVSQLAGADEVLVTRTVTDMTAGGGWHFRDRGCHVLKGVPGEWHVMMLETQGHPGGLRPSPA